jgi:hypothetical protein
MARATTLEVCAMTVQRIAAAIAAIAIPATGFSRRSRKGPRKKNTTTSAATDSDHKMLPTLELIPEAFQIIIAKESCIAWLPRIGAAARIRYR